MLLKFSFPIASAIPLHPDVDDCLRKTGCSLDGLGRCLEVSLGSDQIDQLFSNINIGTLERARQDVTEAFRTSFTNLRCTRNSCLRIGRVTDLLQTILVVKVGDDDLTKRVILTIRIVCPDGA